MSLDFNEGKRVPVPGGKSAVADRRRSLLRVATMLTVYWNPLAWPNWSPIWAVTSFLVYSLTYKPI